MLRHGRFGPIEWAAVRRPLPGEEVCGDHPIALDVGDGAALFGVIDGLGHGEAAADGGAARSGGRGGAPRPSRSTW